MQKFTFHAEKKYDSQKKENYKLLNTKSNSKFKKKQCIWTKY